jgi:hypothetical protein
MPTVSLRIVHQSCSHATHHTYYAVDTTVKSCTKIGLGSITHIYSWFVLQFPLTGMQIVWIYITSNTICTHTQAHIRSRAREYPSITYNCVAHYLRCFELHADLRRHDPSCICLINSYETRDTPLFQLCALYTH